ncbi:TetR/AcrR family transcriptional regulator [Frankia gtarii]|uniref:TetR/AcrR family transcriptional regulator n=1 Tax=Frankia gtarii TaxID=2950102 RepID=UPI0021C202BA|nr:TetR/AcrR family transcriptional regulator [Frankia gtarii]
MARPRTFDEDQVVCAARDQFRTTGYTATSLDDLTAATGLGRGSLYGAFGDKHALFLRALDSYRDEAIAAIRADLSTAGSPLMRLAAHVHAMAAFVIGDTAQRGCLMAKSAAELASTDPEVARRVNQFLTEAHGLLAECIDAAQRAGELAPGHDPAQQANLVLVVLRGMEAVIRCGAPPSMVRDAAEQILALLPRPTGAAGSSDPSDRV